MLFFALRFLLVLAIAQYPLLVSRLSADNEMRAGSVVLAVIVMMVFLASAMPAVASNATATFDVVISGALISFVISVVISLLQYAAEARCSRVAAHSCAYHNIPNLGRGR
jgi:ABC-type uncharacterized transport system permease subunit